MILAGTINAFEARPLHSIVRAEIAEANKTLGANNRRERRKMGYNAHV